MLCWIKSSYFQFTNVRYVLFHKYLATRSHHKGIFIHVIKTRSGCVTVRGRVVLSVVAAVRLYVSQDTVTVLLDI